MLAVLGAIVAGAVILVIVTTPLGGTRGALTPVDPRATPFIIGSPPPQGLAVGAIAPELAGTRSDGTAWQLHDLDGRPVTLEGLGGKVVWLNFFASWCPPCQQETPILRELSERYRERGLEIIGVSVQETSPDDVRAYAERYRLPYTIGFDGSGDLFHAYRVFALPTQFFIDTDGRLVQVVNGPVDEAGASALIESLLPMPAPKPTPTPTPSGQTGS